MSACGGRWELWPELCKFTFHPLAIDFAQVMHVFSMMTGERGPILNLYVGPAPIACAARNTSMAHAHESPDHALIDWTSSACPAWRSLAKTLCHKKQLLIWQSRMGAVRG
jgi:hypothetical protein